MEMVRVLALKSIQTRLRRQAMKMRAEQRESRAELAGDVIDMVAKQIEEKPMSDRGRDIRILEWLGWEWFYSSRRHSDRMLCRPEDNEGHWTPVTTDVPIDEFTLQGLPRLSESLDACEQWIFPVMEAKGYTWMVGNLSSTGGDQCDFWKAGCVMFSGKADTPAKAVVLAAIAYLDGEGK